MRPAIQSWVSGVLGVSLLVISSHATPARAQFCDICGDINGTGAVTSADWNDYLNWLYEVSTRACTDSATGDIDGFAVVGLRDLVWAQRAVFHGGPPPHCDDTQPELDPQPHPDFFLVHNTVFPAGDTVAYLTVEFVNQVPAVAVSAAFQVLVDGVDAPFSTTTDFITPNVFTGWFLESNPNVRLPATWSDPALIGGSCAALSLPPGRRPITDTLHVFMPAAPLDRTMTVELVDYNAYFPEAGVDRNSYVVDSILTMHELTVGPSACPFAHTGDGDLNGVLTASDIILFVNYVFKSGDVPLPCAPVGDVNCDQSVSSSDIIYMVNHVFKGGAPPCDACSVWADPWGCM